MVSWTIRPMVLAVLIFLPFSAMAQSPSPPAAISDQQLLKAEELDALVAPIALYPDTLLAQVLIASTYPLEVVQAERWATENKNLKGDQLKTQVDKQAWDESLKSLVATPSVLTMMSTKLDWTQKLGDAVLAQQPDVMDAIQRLRTKAQANNKLTSTKEQKVTVRLEQKNTASQEQNSTVKQEQNNQIIAIESTSPDTVYVPYYDPAVVYGAWPYPDYPPYDYYPPGYYAGGLLATGLAFGAGYALGHWGANYWGGSINWSGGGNNIQINRGARVEHWRHNPQHRQGVKYKNANVQQKFGNNNLRAGSAARNDFRGRGGQQVLKPGGDRAGLGDRGAGDRGGGLGGAAAGAIAGGAAGAIAGGARGNRGDRGAGNRPSAADRGQAKPAKGKGPSSGAKGPSGGKQAKAGGGPSSGAKRPSGGKQAGAANRPSTVARGGRDTAFGNIGSGRAANLQSQRGRASLGGGGPRMAARGGGGARMGGGGFRGGGGGRGGGRGGGGRRSDVRLKHDIALLGRFDNGIGLYRFTYNGDVKTYVGVMAQEVQMVTPEAVVRGRDGYLRVFYDKLGLKFQTYERWIASGARVPVTLHMYH